MTAPDDASGGTTEASVTELEVCDEILPSPTKEDLDHAFERHQRNKDWSASVTRPNDDYMDAYVLEDGTLEVECEENGRTYVSAGVVDEAILKSLLLSFLAADDSWLRQCKWEVPPPAKPSLIPEGLPKAAVWAGAGAMGLAFGLVLYCHAKWLAMLFALAFPGVIVIAIVSKMREVRRAATWTKGSARITRSEIVTEEREQAGKATRTVTLPAVEYEFSIAFDKFRGDRISIGEIMPNTSGAEETIKRYPVGTSVPVYYNPANPEESVLERELPKNFALIWVFVAVVAVICVGGALWFIDAFK